MQKKKTLRRVILLFTAVLLLLSMALMTSCGKEEEENGPPYDVVFKVKSSLGDEWIFDLDTEELSCEYEYTGQKIDFYVHSCNMPYHPQFYDNWPSGGSGIKFYSTCLYYDTEGIQDKNTRYRSAVEKGTYSYCFETDGSAWMLKFRAVFLRVTIK